MLTHLLQDTRPPSTTGNPLSSSTLQPLNGIGGSRPTVAIGPGGGGVAGSNPASPLPGAAAGKSQHEVLQNFFQSLLRDRGGGTTTAATTNAPNTAVPPPASGGANVVIPESSSPPPTIEAPPPPNGTEEEES